jgi:hypothetical protein
MTTELLKPILILIVGYLLRLALVAYVVAILGAEGAKAIAPQYFK